MNNQAHQQKTFQSQDKAGANIEQKNKKLISWAEVFEKSVNIIAEKYEDSWKDWTQKYDELEVQESNKKKQQRKVTPKILDQDKKQPIVKIKAKVQPKITKHQSTVQNPVKDLHVQVNIDAKQAKQNFRVRTKSVNTHLKSIKKTNELPNIKQEEEKKVLRLKQITKRKIQLMQKLKKIDAELLEARRDASPILDKTSNIQKSFVQSNLNKSYLSNLNNSRSNKQNESVVQHHLKAVEMLQKINNEKLKRQQKVAEQIRKKQQIQMFKLKQLQMKKSIEIQDRRRRNQAGSKLSRHQPDKAKKQLINQSKLNDFVDSDQNALIPTTLVKNKNTLKEDLHEGFFDKVPKSSKHNLLTQRDMEIDLQTHSKQFDQQILQKQPSHQQNQYLGQPKASNQNINEIQSHSQQNLAFPTQPISQTKIPQAALQD